MVKLVDTPAWGAGAGYGVQVRVLFWAPEKQNRDWKLISRGFLFRNALFDLFLLDNLRFFNQIWQLTWCLEDPEKVSLFQFVVMIIYWYMLVRSYEPSGT